ncbi:sulfite exporter TauE/SafE family protein [Aliiruegeria sabulilitoris]|uniref:sulfite exporter TauE/SafE family protein n=1 Tax=Aliiruegeria sabulilitoris TaxID=1510458 RepID=UPI000833A183|nr:sulfite exporter TauE/SafE family protein [Aliiruegeria sabulilitoris]NDR55943.1 sulfite exporter TauE/SafE family protein [Pseudoruegeria sp. M32A2M]
MQIYLPIAQISVDLFLLLGLGGMVGVLSGIFGVGGGFLLTPLLFFIGVPPAVAVATSANQIMASSVSGVLVHLRRGTVDVRMGLALQGGGLIGAVLGMGLFNLLKSFGQVDLLITLFYVVFLGAVGLLMFVEALGAIRRAKNQTSAPIVRRQRNWVHTWPIKRRFRASGLYISVIPPVLVGVAVGVLSAIMGIGGGFILVPAMIYILGMPTKVVIGTSLFQVILVSGATALMHAVTNHTVDVFLATVLLIGGVIGAQFGAMIGAKLKAEQLRILLALLVLAVCLKLGMDLALRPGELYSIAEAR